MLFFVLNSLCHIFLSVLSCPSNKVHKLQLKPELMCKNARKHIKTHEFCIREELL